MMREAKSYSFVESHLCRLQPSTALPYSALLCSTLPCSALLCCTLLTLLYSALPYSAFRIKAYSPPVLKRQSSVLGFSFFDLIEFNMLCRAVSNCRELRQRPYRALVRDPGCLILISMRQSGSIRLVTCPALRSSLLPRFVIMMSCLFAS